MRTVSYSVIDHPRYKYRLDAPFSHYLQNFKAGYGVVSLPDMWVMLSPAGVLQFRPGYMWDGPSGPALDTVDMLRASLVHDGLYQLMAARTLPKCEWKKLADREFYGVMRQDNVPGWRALYAYAAVRWFGGARDEYVP